MSHLGVRARYEIRRNADGLVRDCCEGDLWLSHHDYLWSDGNYSCDCNRYLFFKRAGNEEEDEEYRCGDTAYSVRITEAASGKVLYEDGDWDAAS